MSRRLEKRTPPNPSVRNTDLICTATNRFGRPCGAYAIRGGNVCRVHGGMAPQVRAKAQERINAAADSAAKHLIEWMNDDRVPYSIRLQAAKDLLDRAQIGTDKTVKLDVRPAFEGHLQSVFVDVTPDDDVVDAEIVPDA